MTNLAEYNDILDELWNYFVCIVKDIDDTIPKPLLELKPINNAMEYNYHEKKIYINDNMESFLSINFNPVEKVIGKEITTDMKIKWLMTHEIVHHIHAHLYGSSYAKFLWIDRYKEMKKSSSIDKNDLIDLYHDMAWVEGIAIAISFCKLAELLNIDINTLWKANLDCQPFDIKNPRTPIDETQHKIGSNYFIKNISDVKGMVRLLNLEKQPQFPKFVKTNINFNKWQLEQGMNLFI